MRDPGLHVNDGSSGGRLLSTELVEAVDEDTRGHEDADFPNSNKHVQDPRADRRATRIIAVVDGANLDEIAHRNEVDEEGQGIEGEGEAFADEGPVTLPGEAQHVNMPVTVMTIMKPKNKKASATKAAAAKPL